MSITAAARSAPSFRASCSRRSRLSTCRYHRDLKFRHGPYPSWMRKVGAKTVTRTLSATLAERYRTWFDNTRKLKELVSELQALSVEVVGEAEGWESIANDATESTS